MVRLEEIEKAVTELDTHELARFREWFAEFDASGWDRRFEEDVKAGRLDRLAEEALDDLKEGRCSDL